MQTILVAAGKDTWLRLESKEDELKSIFNAEKVEYCEDELGLDTHINDADKIIFYSDFPLKYQDVCDKAKQSCGVSGIMGVEYVDENKAWLYDGLTVANCIAPREEMAAFQRAIMVPKYVNFIGQWCVALILGCLLTGAIMFSKQCHLVWNSQESEKTIDVEDTQVKPLHN